MAGTLRLQNDFGNAVTVHPDRLRHFVVWDDGGVSFFENGTVCAPHLQFTEDTVVEGVNAILARLKDQGIIPIRLDCGNPVNGDRDTLGYSFFFIPDTIDAWADHLDYYGPEIEPAFTIEEIPFFLSPEEIADFKHALQKRTDAGDWLELSPDAEDGLRCDEGAFGFRKSRITMLFATPERQMLTVVMADQSRIVVPMQDAASRIHDLARHLPHLGYVPDKEDNPRFYCDPVRVPEAKAHMPQFSLSH